MITHNLLVNIILVLIRNILIILILLPYDNPSQNYTLSFILKKVI